MRATEYAPKQESRPVADARLAVAVVFCVALWTPAARADNAAAAEALFIAGRELARRGDVEGACQKFRESYRLDRAVGTELNLAICEAELGHLALAWELFRSLRRALPPGDPRIAISDRHLAELEPRLPRIVLEASGPQPAGLTVRAGNMQLTESGLDVPIPLDPGEHVIVVEAPGFERSEYRVTVREGELYRLQLKPLAPLQRAPDRAASSRTQATKRRSATMHTSGVISLGLAGAALTTSLATGLAVLDRKQTMQDQCDDTGCSDAGVRAADAGSTLATVSTLSFAASLMLAAAGVTLLVIDGKRQSSPSVTLAFSPTGFALRARMQ